MPYLLGVDIGTSSAKAVVVDGDGGLVGVGSKDYPIDQPHPGWAEQDPEDWWSAACAATRQALGHAGGRRDEVVAVGLSGQMHGTVLVDSEGVPVRPAVIWPDQRSAVEVERACEELGLERLGDLAANRLAVGFMAATLLWLKEHEPESLSRAGTVVLPKDYVRLRMTGSVGTEDSDASSTLLYDVANRRWSSELVEEWGLPPELLPASCASSDVVGGLLPDAAEELGLPVGTPVVAGGADQACQLVGNGLMDPGFGSCTIGTGGQVVTPISEPTCDPKLRLSTFCHALPDRWYSLGGMLSAGMSLRWFRDRFCPEGTGYEQLAAEAAEVAPGAEGLIFLPYLVGERTPHFDPLARAAFVGLTPRHGRGHAVRAIMEGVAFSMRDSLEIMRELGSAPARMVVAGGGGGSPVWRQILAEVLDLPLVTTVGSERTAVGAAFLAGFGVGLYDSVDEMRAKVSYGPTVEPSPEASERYEQLYGVYSGLYLKLKDDFALLSE